MAWQPPHLATAGGHAEDLTPRDHPVVPHLIGLVPQLEAPGSVPPVLWLSEARPRNDPRPRSRVEVEELDWRTCRAAKAGPFRSIFSHAALDAAITPPQP